MRLARLADSEGIARVRVAAWRGAYRGVVPDSYLDRPEFEEEAAAYVRDAMSEGADGLRISVADLHGQVAGYCSYGSDSKADGPDLPPTGGVYDLFVHPDHWHSGVGRQLLECAIEYFMIEGLGEATAFVFEANTRARDFYEQAGWRADGYREIEERSAFQLPVVRYRRRLTEDDDSGVTGKT